MTGQVCLLVRQGPAAKAKMLATANFPHACPAVHNSLIAWASSAISVSKQVPVAKATLSCLVPNRHIPELEFELTP